MKKKTLFALGIMLSLCIHACAGGPHLRPGTPIFQKWIAPDSLSVDKLGNRLTTILFSPQKVKCYHLIGQESISEGEAEIERNFVRDSLLADLSMCETAVLQYALFRPAESYKNDTLVVMSPYIPILEFEFTKKKESAHVVISLSDMTWSVIYDGKKQFNYNYCNESIIADFCKYYMSIYKSGKQ